MDSARVDMVNKTFNCSQCGHKHGPRQCPAYNKMCINCNGRNHFANMCRKKTQQEPSHKHRAKEHFSQQKYRKGCRMHQVECNTNDNTSSSSDCDKEYKLDTIQDTAADEDGCN